ncbi:alcohol dehydrogenase [Aspergillus steynii IBT 23096]|uniref:Alcohol dehydrogenase n=1 Tax=Aspergillus steynii IBT 23096 TaxID=1392250 RepID=A0A2I2G1D9_9EURO|nr:alcohol dehydrogenase [Aspergillus steynii IBT 23096]PLB46695.1 alcohol dehydrogenase [Aspergillus steynii IBT 23096]
MTAALPLTRGALIIQGPNTLRWLTSVAIPEITADEILVQTKAVALNPSDWKMVANATVTPGPISGGDFAGVVVKRGNDVGGIEVGDRVFAYVFGANPAHPSHGAFAEYVATCPDLCFRMPPFMSFETGASLGLGLMTVGLVFKSFGLRPFEPPSPNSRTKPYVLVYGGSTATGTLAIQLFKHHGFVPVSTCSPRNFELVQRLGAEAVFDYASPTCKEDIRAYTKGELEYAMDAIADSRATTICYGAIGESGGRYTALESYPERLRGRRKKVKPDWVLCPTIFGERIDLAGSYQRVAQPEDREFAIRWAAHCTALLETGKLQAHPIQVQPGGLQRVANGLDLLRKKQVSGKKLVYPLS